MKLRASKTSPFVRKVMASAIEMGIDDRLQTVETNVWDPETDIQTDNPLGKVPALVTDDGQLLSDSTLICEFLDTQHGNDPLIPADAARRWEVMERAALANGMMDATVMRVMEIRIRPEDKRWPDWIGRQKGKISAALSRMETWAGEGRYKGVDFGNVSTACALGYLDLRFPEEDWRAEAPRLAAWYEEFAKRPSMEATKPS